MPSLLMLFVAVVLAAGLLLLPSTTTSPALGAAGEATRPADSSSYSQVVGTTSYTYDAADQLTQAGSTGYSYDGNGNETTAGSQTFAFDLANRLVSSSDGTATTTYGYDGDGTRLSVTSGGQTTNELWDVNFALPQLTLEQDASGGLLRRYLYGADALSMTTPDGVFYYQHDMLGSTTNLTSEAGAVEWSYSYEPFGAIQSEIQNDPTAPANPLKFVGQHLDSDTDLYHLRARQYDPSSGRFLSIDPLTAGSSFPYISYGPSSGRFLARDPAADALNSSPYAYARDRPTVLIDPTGAFPGSGLLKTTWGTIQQVGPTLVAAYHHPVEFATSAASYSLATVAAVGGLYVGRACWVASTAFLGLLGKIDHPASCGSVTLFVAGLGTPFWYTGYAESQALAGSEIRAVGQSSK